MRKPSSSKMSKRVAKKKIIEIESDSETDEVGSRILAICDEVKASHELMIHSSVETNKRSKQIVCVDDSDFGLERDEDYTKYLASFSDNHHYLLEYHSPPMRLEYNVENKASGRSKGRSTKVEKSRLGSPLVSSVSKKLKTTKETKQNKEDARRGLKIALAKNAIKLKHTSNVKGEALRERKMTKNNVKASKKESSERINVKACKIGLAKNNIELNRVKDIQRKKEEALRRKEISVARNSERENAKSSKKVIKVEKTIPMVNAKRKKDEVLWERKISVTKNNAKSQRIASKRVKVEMTNPMVNTERNRDKSKSHVKVESVHSFKASKKENEEHVSSIDERYEYYLKYLRNSITICAGPDRKSKDLVCLADPDIIAISNFPFSDGINSPFEANKNGKITDLEDGNEDLEELFNSSFSKKLLEVLIKPYDKKEFLELYNEASLKRQATRSRQLRDGREIEYNVDDQLRLSYFEKYPDFNKVFSHCRKGKDHGKALNLLRGFFFYIKNIVHEGAFKPWMYEKHMETECKVLKLLHCSS